MCTSSVISAGCKQDLQQSSYVLGLRSQQQIQQLCFASNAAHLCCCLLHICSVSNISAVLGQTSSLQNTHATMHVQDLSTFPVACKYTVPAIQLTSNGSLSVDTEQKLHDSYHPMNISSTMRCSSKTLHIRMMQDVEREPY